MIWQIKHLNAEKKGVYISFFIYALLLLSMFAKLSQSGNDLLSLNSFLTFILIFCSIVVVLGYCLSKSWAREAIITLNIVFAILTIFMPLVLYVVFIGLSDPEFFKLYFKPLNLFLLLLGAILSWTTYLLTRNKG